MIELKSKLVAIFQLTKRQVQRVHDLCAVVENGQIEIKPGERVLIGTGLSLKIPVGHHAEIRSRSGLTLEKGLVVLNSPGTIDCDYRGAIKIILANLGTIPQTVSHGDRIAQIVFMAYEKAAFDIVESLESTDRDAGGFGSTGVLIGNSLIAHQHVFYLYLLAAQLVFYSTAVAGHFVNRWISLPAKMLGPYYFVILNAACTMAFWKFLQGQKIVLWTPRIGV